MDGNGERDVEENGEQKGQKVQETQVPIRFHTKMSPEFYVVNTPFYLSAKLTRFGLSDIINKLLSRDKVIPFDFLLDGELIRTSLEKYMLSRELSAEAILNIEYLPAVLPPTPRDSHLQDDWISAVDGTLDSVELIDSGGGGLFGGTLNHPSGPGKLIVKRCVFTGSYDNLVRVWSSEGACVRVLKGHTDAVTALTLVSTSDVSGGEVGLVSASKDRTLRMWQNVAESPEPLASKTLSPTKVFKGHTASVQSVAASSSGSQIASGSWDSSIRLWNTKQDDDDDEESAKKRKLDDAGVPSENGKPEVFSQTTLEGHTQCVSAVAYAEDNYLYSVSWDHSVRGWNLDTGECSLNLVCDKALLCLSIGGEGSALLATGGADQVLRIWDPRMIAISAPVLQFASHRAWITSCRWHPRSTYHLLSSSHDGTLKLWDVRAKVPLHTIEAHEDKVFCADWWREDCIISGGADSKLNILQGVNLNLGAS